MYLLYPFNFNLLFLRFLSSSACPGDGVPDIAPLLRGVGGWRAVGVEGLGFVFAPLASFAVKRL